MIDLIVNKTIKTTIVTGAWIYWQVSQISGGIINQAFDKMFSLGLLVVIVYLLWKDNRSARDYNEQRDRRIEQLVSENTEAIHEFESTMSDLADSLEKLTKKAE